MMKKQFSKFNCRFSKIDDLIGSINNKELMLLLKKHNINLEQEIGEVVSPINKSGKMFPLLMPSPSVPSDKAIDAARDMYQREGVLSYYPEYLFADDYGMGFVIRFRENKGLDRYAMIVRGYDKKSNYINIFDNKHNIPEEAVEEYINSVNLGDLTKLPFNKDHCLTYRALCTITKNTGDLYVEEVSPEVMQSPLNKRAVLSSIMDDVQKHGYDVIALYSNSERIVQCENKLGNPFDSFVLDVEYYNLEKRMIYEEHYVIAHAQEYIPTKDTEGQIFRDEQNRVYYGINHTLEARGKPTAFKKNEAKDVFHKFLAAKFNNRYPILPVNSISE